MGSSFQKFFILYKKRHRQSKMDRQCLFILNFQICSFMVEKRYLSGSFPFLIKQKSQKALISLTFWLVRSRGWENRTPTKGFGDPYHTIWPIPYIQKKFNTCCSVKFSWYSLLLYLQNFTQKVVKTSIFCLSFYPFPSKLFSSAFFAYLQSLSLRNL